MNNRCTQARGPRPSPTKRPRLRNPPELSTPILSFSTSQPACKPCPARLLGHPLSCQHFSNKPFATPTPHRSPPQPAPDGNAKRRSRGCRATRPKQDPQDGVSRRENHAVRG